MDRGLDDQGRRLLRIAAENEYQNTWIMIGDEARCATIQYDEEARPYFRNRQSRCYLHETDNGWGYATVVFVEHPKRAFDL